MWLFLHIKNILNLKQTNFFSKTRLLAHVQLRENISSHKCLLYSLTLWHRDSARFRKEETVQYVLNAFYTKARLSQGLFPDMDYLKTLPFYIWYKEKLREHIFFLFSKQCDTFYYLYCRKQVKSINYGTVSFTIWPTFSDFLTYFQIIMKQQQNVWYVETIGILYR